MHSDLVVADIYIVSKFMEEKRRWTFEGSQRIKEEMYKESHRKIHCTSTFMLCALCTYINEFFDSYNGISFLDQREGQFPLNDICKSKEIFSKRFMIVLWVVLYYSN